ncbi:NAD(P)H-dependent oxidoreductase subunit E [Francisellaceae bacterium]|nr:NAD(P)H-dependent oxidoreductase subunit E [Francisellaceae bacterium]
MLAEQVFSQKVIDQLEFWLAKYPKDQRQSAVIPGLHILQDENGGFLTTVLMDQLADYIGMPEIAVYEVATFYGMYDLEVVGKNKINVCDNISCVLNGANEIIEHISSRLSIKPGETTEDGRITLKRVECQGACCGAPMLEVNQKFYENLTIESVDKIIDSLEA